MRYASCSIAWRCSSDGADAEHDAEHDRGHGVAAGERVERLAGEVHGEQRRSTAQVRPLRPRARVAPEAGQAEAGECGDPGA